MSDVEEVQEQIKADISALKDQMASMMEAMLGMERLVESNAATAATASIPIEADPVLQPTPCLVHHLASGLGGGVRGMVGHANDPGLGYSRNAYGLSPNFTPAMHGNINHATPATFKGQPPGCAHEGPQERAHGDIDNCPYLTIEGPALEALPQPNIAGVSQHRPIRPLLYLVKERIRAVKGFSNCPFTDMADPPPDRTQLQGMCKGEHESFRGYTQRWKDMAALVTPLMMEKELVEMIVDTLPVSYYEKMMGYMPSSFTDLVVIGERIEVGLGIGKFNCLTLTNKEPGANRKKESGKGTRVLTAILAWPNFPPTQ